MDAKEKEDILYGIKRAGIFLANHQLKGITKVLDARVQKDKVDNIHCPECGEFIGVGLLMSKPLSKPSMVHVRPLIEEQIKALDQKRKDCGVELHVPTTKPVMLEIEEEQAQKDFDEEDETHEKNLLAHGFD